MATIKRTIQTSGIPFDGEPQAREALQARTARELEERVSSLVVQPKTPHTRKQIRASVVDHIRELVTEGVIDTGQLRPPLHVLVSKTSDEVKVVGHDEWRIMKDAGQLVDWDE